MSQWKLWKDWEVYFQTLKLEQISQEFMLKISKMKVFILPIHCFYCTCVLSPQVYQVIFTYEVKQALVITISLLTPFSLSPWEEVCYKLS